MIGSSSALIWGNGNVIGEAGGSAVAMISMTEYVEAIKASSAAVSLSGFFTTT
jgi:hypothetical protein